MTELPPLPEPAYYRNELTISEAYTADQMREYAKKAVEAEREWLLDLVFSYADHLTCDDDFQAALDARR